MAEFSRHFRFMIRRRDQRSSCSTLACDWLASASAETAIDWRVDSAWLLAASSLVSASVRFDAPVCNTLIRFFEKSWRICTIERFEPRVEASERSVLDAVFNDVSTLLAEALSRKSVPEVRVARPRPAELNVTPVMLRVDLPVSLNVSFSVSPFNRLMPLNEASCAVVLICASTLLYCATRLARCDCEVGSTTAAAAVRPLNACPLAVDVPATVPIVDDAASFEVVMLILPVEESIVACRLFAASAVLSWFNVETCPLPVPKVMLVAVPPPVAPMVSVSPLNVGGTRLVVPAVRPSLASAEPEITRFCVVPVESVILPLATEDAVLAPVTVSIAASRWVTLSPTPILVPELVVPATKVKVVPSTTSVSPVVMELARSFDVLLAVPDNRVAPVMATADATLSLLTAVPVTVALVLEVPSRLLAVAPVMAAEV